MYIDINVYLYNCTYIYILVHIFLYMYIYIYIYICTHMVHIRMSQYPGTLTPSSRVFAEVPSHRMDHDLSHHAVEAGGACRTDSAIR